MIEGTYVQKIKVKNLPEGYEYQPNRFITDKQANGCRITYRSQEGDIRYFRTRPTDLNPIWLGANTFIDCQVDFVPDSYREKWVQLQKLGKCYLDYRPSSDNWAIVYPENPALADIITNDIISGAPAATTIDETMWDISFSHPVVHNGYRWFDCRDTSNFKKISDDEAKKLRDDE